MSLDVDFTAMVWGEGSQPGPCAVRPCPGLGSLLAQPSRKCGFRLPRAGRCFRCRKPFVAVCSAAPRWACQYPRAQYAGESGWALGGPVASSPKRKKGPQARALEAPRACPQGTVRGHVGLRKGARMSLKMHRCHLLILCQAVCQACPLTWGPRGTLVLEQSGSAAGGLPGEGRCRPLQGAGSRRGGGRAGCCFPGHVVTVLLVFCRARGPECGRGLQ